jgi:hypothetical protein
MRALSLFLLFFASACATTPVTTAVTDAPKAADYAPLAIGKSMTYQVSYPGQKGEMTVVITGEKDGYFLDDREGAFRHTSEGLRDKQRYLIRHPLNAGETWKTVVSASAVEHNKIISAGERCECLAGTFPDCLVVESTIRRDAKVSLIVRWTWAKGLGLVKLETEAEIAGQGRVPQVKQSLVRYGSLGEPSQESPGKQGDSEEEAPNNWTR